MLKMILRGIARYRVKGRKLLILIALSTAVLVLSFSFTESFALQQEDVLIENTSGHLVISPTGQTEYNLLFLEMPDILQDFLDSAPEIRAAGPMLNLVGNVFHRNGDHEGTFYVKSLDPEVFSQLFPGVEMEGGTDDFSWEPEVWEVPMLRNRIESHEIQEEDRYLVPQDILLPPGEWQPLAAALARDFPAVFPRGPVEDFLPVINASLDREDLIDHILDTVNLTALGNYDILDTLDERDLLLEEGVNLHLLPVLNKMALTQMYPDYLRPVHQQTRLNVPMTLQVPPYQRQENFSALPVTVPVRYVGYANSLPLFSNTNYMSRQALAHWLELPPEAATTYQILLHDKEQLTPFLNRLLNFLFENHLLFSIRTYREGNLGHWYLMIGDAFRVVSSALMALMALAIAIFIANGVSLALKKRRREIGTGFALGMGPWNTALVFLGEYGLLVTLSWILGASLGAALVLYLGDVGIPGMFFFPSGRLFLNFRPEYLLSSYGILMAVALPAIVLPLLELRKMQIVQLLGDKH